MGISKSHFYMSEWNYMIGFFFKDLLKNNFHRIWVRKIWLVEFGILCFKTLYWLLSRTFGCVTLVALVSAWVGLFHLRIFDDYCVNCGIIIKDFSYEDLKNLTWFLLSDSYDLLLIFSVVFQIMVLFFWCHFFMFCKHAEI